MSVAGVRPVPVGPARWRQPWAGELDAFTFVLPAGWARIRLLEAHQRDRDVDRLAAALARGRPDHERVRPQVSAHVRQSLPAAGRHAVEAHLSTTLGGAPPLACALVVSILPVTAARPADLCAGLLATAGAGAVVGLVDHHTGPVARLQRQLCADPAAGGPAPAELVQHLFPALGGGAVLLSASTPQLDLGEPLRAVFDAVASSFRWLA